MSHEWKLEALGESSSLNLGQGKTKGKGALMSIMVVVHERMMEGHQLRVILRGTILRVGTVHVRNTGIEQRGMEIGLLR